MTREFEIRLVTPLFGGGVEAGAPDETMPIRATSIRGQLQFWWRATRGARFADHRELSTRHAEIWGTTERASPVEMQIRDVNPNPVQVEACAAYEWNAKARQGRGKWDLTWKGPFARPEDRRSSNPLPYVLFPFQGREPRPPHEAPAVAPGDYVPGASFTLRLRYPEDLTEDVETAVWAWVNFGGLGARTRRGCGALLCKELAPRDTSDLHRWFKSASYHSGSADREWPTIPSSLLVGNQVQTPIDAWKQVIGLLQSFRQAEGVGRNPGRQKNRPGRSRWPEPETIRRVTGRRSVQHGRLAHSPDDAFPRAELGLPIVFHFQGQGEPPDTVLYPSGAERMASPLILKPLALGNGKAVPLVMRLVTPSLTGVELKQGDRTLKLPDTAVIRAPRLAKDTNSPLAYSPSGSALDAFLNYVREDDRPLFKEIKR